MVQHHTNAILHSSILRFWKHRPRVCAGDYCEVNKEVKYFRNVVLPTPPIPKAGPVRQTRINMAEVYSEAINCPRAMMLLLGLLYRSNPRRFKGVDRSWIPDGHASCKVPRFKENEESICRQAYGTRGRGGV